MSDFSSKVADAISSTNNVNTKLSSYEYLNNFWNYKIFNIEGNDVAVSNFLIATIIFIIGILYLRKINSKITKFLSKKFDYNRDAINAVENITTYSLILFLFSISMQIAHIPLRSLAFIGGALAIGVGLGAQHLINNFISSLIILLERPVKIGDEVEIDNIRGHVISIGTRCIKLKLENLEEVLIPNSIVIQNNLFNKTLSDNRTKLEINLKFYKNELARIAEHVNLSENNISLEEIKKLEKPFKNYENISKIKNSLHDVLDQYNNNNGLDKTTIKIVFKEISKSFYEFKLSFEYNYKKYLILMN